MTTTQTAPAQKSANRGSNQNSATVQPDALRELIRRGLPSLRAGLREAERHIEDIISAATDDELKDMLRRGKETSAQWAQRVERAMSEASADDSGDNPVIEAHEQVAERIREAAPTDGVRDLGIIASGQLALHYWIGAFGTMASYAKQTGQDQTAKAMSDSVDEARRADEMHTDLAYRLMGGQEGKR